MIPEIITPYLNGRLMLFLGAGASVSSTDRSGSSLPLGGKMAEEMAALIDLQYNHEPLSTVYSAVNSRDAAGLHQYLKRRLTNTKPSEELKNLFSRPWPRIYTTNIDDCIETAIRYSRLQNIDVHLSKSNLVDMDPSYGTVQLIKLNGSADRPEDGFIFSPQEYGHGSASLPIWYKELAQNYSGYTFVFIGTQLNEPLFQHAIADMRTNRHPQKGYVITPRASEIEKTHLSSLNLQHISGDLKDFSDWLIKETPNDLKGWDLAVNRRPELRSFSNFTDQQRKAINCITSVKRESVPKTFTKEGAIRNFYKGFQPSWTDILDDVPARLEIHAQFLNDILEYGASKKMVGLIGPAGCGKTTTLMMSALSLSEKTDAPVYYLRDSVTDLRETLVALEEMNNGLFYLFVDKVDLFKKQILDFLSSGRAKNICIIFNERGNIWTKRIHEFLQPYVSCIRECTRIEHSDVDRILEKLERFGAWTRLEKMSLKERRKQIEIRADRQLLIALLEATTGQGFIDIIKSDYNDIGDLSHQKFVILAGFGTIHRQAIKSNDLGRALINVEVSQDVNSLTEELKGLVAKEGERLSVRHPIYVRELFAQVVPPELLKTCLIGLLSAYGDYNAPVGRSLSKVDGAIFKSITNHRFIEDIMRRDEQRVRDIYSAFETKFHVDGLYWLQYGLALRSFRLHGEALEKFTFARQAHSSPQIDHAYAQQLLIMATAELSWESAEIKLQEAIGILQSLNTSGWDADTYPIVSMAEGHIKIVEKFKGLNEARKIAGQYANQMFEMRRKNSNQRLEAATKNVTSYSLTGLWSANEEPEEFS